MRMFRHISAPLLLSLALSGMLHAAAIFSIPGTSVLGIAGLFSEKMFSAALVREGPEKLYARGPAGKYAGVYSPRAVSKEDGIRTDGKNEGGAGVQEKVPADPGKTPEVAPPGEEKKGTLLEDPAKEKDKEDALKVAKNILPEGAVMPSKLSKVPGIINLKREKFYYDIYWMGIYVGNAVIEAVNNGGIIRITSEVHSAPFISTFYEVEDYAESRVKDGRPFNFRIRQHEGKYRSDKETIFDADNKKITYYDYLKGTKDEHIVGDSMFWDVISGFYHLRTRGLEPETTVFVDIFDSNKVLNAEVNVLGRESVKFIGKGDIDAIVVKPILKSDGLFQNKGDIRIWLSDDENRMPVRVETKVSIGNVTAALRRVETER